MKKCLNIVLALAFSTTLIFVSCRKKETTEVDNETQSAVDNAVADQEYASIVPAVNNHAINTKGAGSGNRLSSSVVAACDTLKWLNATSSFTTAAGNVFPMADTLLKGPSFGIDSLKYKKQPIYELDLNAASSCAASFGDGKVRNGKWIVRITGPIKKTGSQMILKLVNYKASNITYSCDSIVVTTVASNSVFSTYNIRLTGGVCQTSNWKIQYKFDRTITNYPKGNPVGNISGPVTKVFGTASGVNREGRAFTVNMPQSSACVKHKICKYIDQGVIELTPDGFKTRTINFGSGACDNKATFTVNGKETPFDLD